MAQSSKRIIAPGFGTSLEIGNETIAARVGSAFSFNTDTPVQSWSAGFSLNQSGKQLHYTYLNHGDLEYKHLVSIGMSFGGQQPVSQKQQSYVEAPTPIQLREANPIIQTRLPEQKPTKYKTVQIAEDIQH